MLRFLSVDCLITPGRKLISLPEVIANEKSQAVAAIIGDNPNIITDPILADFHYLERGDTLESTNPGTRREVLENNKEKKIVICMVTRTTESLSPFPLFYENEGDIDPISKEVLIGIAPKALFTMDGDVYIPTTLHSVIPGELPEDDLKGKYSMKDMRRYSTLLRTTTKIIKKRK